MQEIHLDTIDSTNTYAKSHKKTFSKTEITCITAEEQTAGRGRYQRKWISPKHVNLYATFFFTIPSHTRHIVSLAQLMALSLTTVLIEEGLKPEIKWPNDIRLNGKKVSGILCEMQFYPEYAEVFLGIGINVNLDLDAAAQIDQPATSLYIETKKTWDKKALLKKLQAQFVKDLEKFKEEGFTPFHKQFDKLLAFKGKKIQCFDGKKVWEGICHSLTEDGQLNLLLPDQTIHTVLAGDIK